jgi:hypothetical protein
MFYTRTAGKQQCQLGGVTTKTTSQESQVHTGVEVVTATTRIRV